MEISSTSRDGNVVLAVAGELDLHTVQMLLAAVTRALDTVPAVITIDAAEVTFADSAAVHGLLGARDAVVARGATLRLTRVYGQVEQVLSMTGMDQIFEIVDS